MNACLHDWQRTGTRLDVKFVIDDWQGPTDAIVECAHCRRHALVRLLHWSGRNLSTRIFAVSTLDERAVAVFLRNMKSNYCDLTRHAAEIAALEASADRTSGGLIANGPDMTVLSTLEVGELGGPKIRSWRESSPDEGDPFWLAIVSRHRQHA